MISGNWPIMGIRLYLRAFERWGDTRDNGWWMEMDPKVAN